MDAHFATIFFFKNTNRPALLLGMAKTKMYCRFQHFHLPYTC